MNLLALTLVFLFGLYLIGLAVAVWLSPATAAGFLGGFASSAFTHYLELGLRLVAGGAILRYAPQMLFSGFFVLCGWGLVLTTVGLLAVPWRWHHRFAQWTVPYAIRNLRLLAVASFAFGGFILAAVILGGQP
ncbi:hypothetical protein BH24ACI5_BH24ACI5_04090 [soil metagenome]